MRFTFCRPAFVCCFLSVWSFCTLSLFGQSTTSLRGTVTDAQNAAIADAVVLMQDTSNGFERSTITSTAGEYQFAQVPPGTYNVTVKKPGFSAFVNHNVKLEVNTPATLDCHMELGSVATTVDVQES